MSTVETYAAKTEREARERRENLIRGLRELADWLERRPQVEIDMGWSDSAVVELGFHVSCYSEEVSEQKKDEFVQAVRNMGGGDKNTSSYQFEVARKFGEGTVKYSVTTPREAVCTKRVISKTTVREMVPDYSNVPKVEKERVVEEVEWTCPDSLLAS
jgi:hypothetical protein